MNNHGKRIDCQAERRISPRLQLYLRNALVSLSILVLATVLATFACLAIYPAQTIATPDNDLVRVGVYDNPPKIFTDSQGKPAGIFIDIIEAIAESEDWEISYVPGTFAEGLDRLAAGAIDIMPDVALTAERRNRFSFHDTPVLSSWSQVYAREGSGIRSIVDLGGKKIAILTGSLQEEAFTQLAGSFGAEIELISVPDYDAGFAMVAQGEADAAVTNQFYGLANAESAGLEDTAVVFAPSDLFFAVSSGDPLELLNPIEHRLVALKGDSSSIYYQSLKHWTSGEVPFEFPSWARALVWAVGIALFATFCGAFLLKRQVNTRTRELETAGTEMKQRLAERRQVEASLHESEERYRRLTDNAADIVFRYDLFPTAGLTYINPTIYTVTGYTPEECYADPNLILTIAHPDDAYVMTKTLQMLSPPREPVITRWIGKDGVARWMEIRMVPVRDDAGRLVALEGMARDISERKRVEEEYQTLFREMLDAFAVHEIICNEDGYPIDYRFLAINPAFERMFDLKAEEVLGRTVLEVMPSSEPEWLDTFARVVQTGDPILFEAYSAPVGRHFRVTAYRPSPNQFACILSDITERIHAEKALREQDEQLRQSQKMEAIGRLAGGIAHDFNNLLTAIIGYSDLLLHNDTLVDKPVLEDVKEIRRAAERAGGLTQQILAFSRRQVLQSEVMCINELIRDIMPLLRRTLGEDIEVFMSLDPDLWSTEIDPHRFTQVLMNLALNARDAMRGGGRLTFQTGNVQRLDHPSGDGSNTEPVEYVSLSVSDTGIGIDVDQIGHIFDPFYTTKDPGEGTGLGLSIVYGIVKQSGGIISVESKLGEGSTFQVFLPRVENNPALEYRQGTGGETDLLPVPHNERILVVEDEEAVRDLVERILNDLGYTVLTASEGSEALTVLNSLDCPVHLLITDVVLPRGMNGSDVARAARLIRTDLPVLFISGYTRGIVIDGGDGWERVYSLAKPFSVDELKAKVREALAR